VFVSRKAEFYVDVLATLPTLVVMYSIPMLGLYYLKVMRLYNVFNVQNHHTIRVEAAKPEEE